MCMACISPTSARLMLASYHAHAQSRKETTCNLLLTRRKYVLTVLDSDGTRERITLTTDEMKGGMP